MTATCLPNEEGFESLRPYRRSDLDRMVALDKECFAPEFQFDLRTLQRYAERPRSHTLVAESATGVLVGFVIVEQTGFGTSKTGYCVTLDVAPLKRRRGLGQLLLLAGERWAARNGAAYLNLHVWVGNGGAIRFYERLGYTLQGTVPEFYGGGGMDALVYSKRLAE